MRFNNRNYPKSFPEGCPPEEATEHRIKVYRLVENNIIINNDFKSLKELGRDARLEKYPFIEYGLSVNKSYEELKKCWRGTPGLKKKFKNIASGITYECTGVIQYTPTKIQNNHYTWWVYEEVKPEIFFKIEGGE